MKALAKGVADVAKKTKGRILKLFHFLNPKIKVRRQLGEWVRVWRGGTFPVAVHNSPSMSAALRSESMKYEIMQVYAKALYTPIPTMIWEVTMNITKLTALSK